MEKAIPKNLEKQCTTNPTVDFYCSIFLVLPIISDIQYVIDAVIFWKSSHLVVAKGLQPIRLSLFAPSGLQDWDIWGVLPVQTNRWTAQT